MELPKLQTSPKPQPNKQSIAILDAGAQCGKLIDRRVRDLSVQSELVPLDAPTKCLNRTEGWAQFLP